jgi:DNA helicase-2/ATP-dependent DNA helicase PcrA
VEPERLNRAQALAARTLDGPVLVVAGAGTGKTRTLVHRLTRLVRAGASPEAILLLTFTRRAAAEMVARAEALLGKSCPVAGGTFHGFAHRMLRRHGRAVGVPADFAVLDQGDAFELLADIRAELKLGGRGRSFPRRQTIAAILGKAVNKKVSIGRVLREEYPHLASAKPGLEKVARRYAERKAEGHLVDFDDLLVLLIRLLEARPESAASYSHVMVDEYQDTNLLQARITELLAGATGDDNVMVVGDDAQSIYAFRGAHYRNLLEFDERFPGARRITLEQSYRCTQPILELSNALMAQMSVGFRKQLFTRREGGERPLLVEAADEEQQARYVTRAIEALRRDGVPLSEMAVLYRANTHAAALELQLGRRKLPFVKYGGFRFLESAHIRDVVAHLRVVANPTDELSLVRVLALRPGIGRAGAQKIARGLGGGPCWEGLRAVPGRKKARPALRALADLLEELDRLRARPQDALFAAVEGYAPLLQERFDDWPRRARDLEQLVGLCDHASLEELLAELAIDPPNRSRGEALAGGAARDELVLSTLHSAKGLEWRVVFIIQAAEGCIPLYSGFDGLEPDLEKLDEELRLLYVGVTRARDRLTVVWPRWTTRGYSWGAPSRFIGAMSSGLFERQRASGRSRRRG